MLKPVSALRGARALFLVACAGCAQSDYPQTSEPRLGNAAQAIFGGAEVSATDPVAKASVALLEGDGEQICSGTLIAPRVIVSAAHCFTTFRPYYVSFGVEVAQQGHWTDDFDDRAKFPNLRKIVSFTVHPNYDPSVTRDNAEELRPASDVAVAVIADGAPLGFVPSRIIAPSSGMVTDLTIAGFGAFPEYDAYNPQPPRLRKVDTFVGAVLTQSGFIKDGPNPGKGSCVRDSGGSVYLRTNLTDTPVLIGNVVSGPLDCSQGIGYNSDLRRHVAWIEQTTGASLSKVTLSSSCHNGIVDAGEACDGEDLDCTDLNDPYTSGRATCRADCSGYDVSQCVEPTTQPSCVSSACAATGLPLPIPDNSTTGVTSSIEVGASPGPFERVLVSARLSHTYRGDLELTLISPSGTQHRLHNRTGGGADDITISEQSVALAAENPAGKWRLWARDLSRGDTGTLQSWSLRLVPAKASVCGDGKAEGSEVCDGNLSCADLDGTLYQGGTAVCLACGSYDVSRCIARTSVDDCAESPCMDQTRRAIPDNNTTGVTSELVVSRFSGSVAFVRVAVDIEHTYRGDLRVRLVSPSGRTVTLVDRTGSSADNLSLDRVLSDYSSTDPVGTWKLIVSDHGPRDVGSLVRWSIQLQAR